MGALFAIRSVTAILINGTFGKEEGIERPHVLLKMVATGKKFSGFW